MADGEKRKDYIGFQINFLRSGKDMFKWPP